MSYSHTMLGVVRSDHLLSIAVPADFPTGPVSITVTADSPTDEPMKMTAAELARSEFAGDWEGRTDLPNSTDEFLAWRRKLWEPRAD